jgi:hypothetical protein
MNEDKYKHGQIVICPHTIVLGSKNFPEPGDFTDIPCDGETRWDIVLEGVICDKCELYTGVK